MRAHYWPGPVSASHVKERQTERFGNGSSPAGERDQNAHHNCSRGLAIASEEAPE